MPQKNNPGHGKISIINQYKLATCVITKIFPTLIVITSYIINITVFLLQQKSTLKIQVYIIKSVLELALLKKCAS